MTFAFRDNRPRGLRNNNPGNLKELPGDRTQWKGERATDDDPVFEEFTDPRFGIRAIGKVLDSYARRGIVTLSDIIHTYAPGSENDTQAYIEHVASNTGFNPNAPISRAHYPDLIAAIILQENGQQPFPREMVVESLAIA